MGNETLDAAFVRMPITNLQGLIIYPLAEEAMIVALPIGHRLAKSNRGATAALALKALSDETFVVYRSHGAWAWLRDGVLAACHSAGFSPRIGQEAPHIVSALPLVAAGIGLAIVPASLEQMNIRGVAYRRLNRAAKLKAPLSLALRRSGTSKIVRHFLELSRRTAKDYQSD